MVNAEGRRFCNESRGYSEAAADVIAQPGGMAFVIFRCAWRGRGAAVRGFPQCRGAGRNPQRRHARRTCRTDDVPADVSPALSPPWRRQRPAVRPARSGGTSPALPARHLLQCSEGDRRALSHPGRHRHRRKGPRAGCLRPAAGPNLLAAGGAACGVSGADASGYLSGNGLLTAIALGAIAGGFEVPRVEMQPLGVAL